MNLLIITTVFAPMHILLLVGAVLLMFGGKKIPELMSGLGKGMKDFKKAIKEDDETTPSSSKETPGSGIKNEPLKE